MCSYLDLRVIPCPLLINVTQSLVPGIHGLEDRSILEDSIRRHRRAKL